VQTRLVVLQPTAFCNLNCTYCYLPSTSRRDATRMSQAVLERTIRVVLGSSVVVDSVELLWHAGEPLSVGRDFYARALDLIELHNTRNIAVQNNLQTNATLIDEQWAAFLVQNRFSVGVSIDGPACLHDESRLNWAGRGSHQLAMRGVQHLRNEGADPAAICVLTRAALRRPREILDFFVENGFSSLAFNVEEVERANTTSSLGIGGVEAEYRSFIDQFYDAWWPHREQLEIREFSDLSYMMTRFMKDPSWARPVLDTQPLAIVTVQVNGDMSTFSPEFAGARASDLNQFILANINDVSSIDELAQAPRFTRLASEAATSVAMCRQSCGFFALCGGEFLSNKFSENGTLLSTETQTCRLHRQVLTTALLDKLREE
jgi:uncharacterized protein